MTREEIQSKLQAIKNNNALPEKQKGMLIDKYEKMLGDLTPAASPKPKAEKKTTEPKLKAQKDPETGETFYPVSYEYFDRVWKSKKDPRKEIALTIGWDVFSYDEFEELGNGDFEKGLREYLKKMPGASLDFQPDQDGTIYRIVFKDSKTTSKKPAKKTDESDYDCDDLIEEAKERKAKALAAYEKRKNAPKKSAATKSKDAVIRAEKSVEKGVKKGDISISEIEKIIAEYEDAIKKLKALLETAKNKMGNGGSVDPEEVEHILMKAQGIKDHHCKCHDKMARGGYIVKYGPKNDAESDVIYQAGVNSKKEADSFVEILKANGHKNISVVPKSQSKMARGGGVDKYEFGDILSSEDVEFEPGKMVSKPFFVTIEGFSGEKQEFQIKNKFHDNIIAAFPVGGYSNVPKSKAESKANAFYEAVKNVKSWEEYEKKSEQFIVNWNKENYERGGGVDERVVLSFSFNEDNVDLKDVISLVDNYSNEYDTSGDMSERSVYITLKKSKANELKSDLKSEFGGYLYDFEMQKSRYQYAQGGSLKEGFAIMQRGSLRTDAFKRVEVFKTKEAALFKMSHVPLFKSLSKEEKLKLIVPYSTSNMATGGRLKESDIEIGNKYELMNGETIEIKRLFVENGDENWVAFTRSSAPNQIFENSLSGLKNFINNWRKKMATGGAIEMGSWVQARKGNARGQVYHKDGEFVKLKDKYGNESNTLYHTRDLKMSSRPRYEQGGVVGQEITFDFQGEEKQGVISQITDRGDYIVTTPDGRTLLAEKDMDVIALGEMNSSSMKKKRFGFFETGGSMYDQDM
jgi:hypothetical protein